MRKCTVTLLIKGYGPKPAQDFFHHSSGLGSLLYMSAREGCSLDVAAAALGFHSSLSAWLAEQSFRNQKHMADDFPA